MKSVRIALTASLFALLLLFGAGAASAQTQIGEECYPIDATCVEGIKFGNDDPAPAVAPTNLQRTHPVTGFDATTALLVAAALGAAGAGLFGMARRADTVRAD